jgi:hypothetical protein
MLPQLLTHNAFEVHRPLTPSNVVLQVTQVRQVALGAKKGFGSTAKQVGSVQTAVVQWCSGCHW